MSSQSPPELPADIDGDNGGNNDQTELFIAIAALVISIIAFVVSILQALQQYFSTASGYSSVGPKVIGRWSEHRRRRFLWSEFRFEVTFLTPVLFVARPTNRAGPMGKAEDCKITLLDGQPQNYADSLTITPKQKKEQEERRKKNTDSGRVHTADNEEATWLALMQALHGMENDSRDWQRKALKSLKNYGFVPPPSGEPAQTQWPPSPHGGHNMVVCIQKKKKSWDTIPGSVSKPYATTTISHIVEMAAMLGIFWLVFDRENDRYLAQGNGYVLTGSNMEGLGLTFSLQIKGKPVFGVHRVVPHYDVKELCFGLSPTTFRQPNEKADADEPKTVGTLQLGTMEEISESLVTLGCNAHTVNYFRDAAISKSRLLHLFPIAFELLGMIGVVYQVKGTVFRTLPNPTPFRWDPGSFDLLAILEEYDLSLEEIKPLDRSDSEGSTSATSYPLSERAEQIRILLRAIKDAFSQWKEASSGPAHIDEKPNGPSAAPTKKDTEPFVSTRDLESQGPLSPRLRFSALGRRITGRAETIVVTSEKDEKLPPPSVAYSPAIFESLHTAIEACDAYLLPQQNAHDRSSPLRQVLRSHLQVALDTVNAKPDESPDRKPYDPSVPGAPTIQDLDAASEHKHRLFVDMYFHSIRERVVDKVRRRAQGARAMRSQGQTQVLSPGEASDIWLTLVFRMLCWLLLHHFHEKDVQVSKADVYESRLPVYII